MNQDTYQQHIFYQKYHDEEYNFIGSIKVYFKKLLHENIIKVLF